MGRPPSSHPNFPQPGMSPQQIEAMSRMAQANGGRMPNGAQWPQGAQGLPNAGNQQPGGMGTQQRPGNMPPPPAPSDNQAPAPRAQESSPAQPPAPPTPSQSTKAAPKKKESAASKKKNAPKKQGAAAAAAAAAATPASEAEPPTPTPATPTQSMHRDSFTKGGAQQSAPANAPPSQPPQAQASQSMDPNAGAPSLFGGAGGIDDVSFSWLHRLINNLTFRRVRVSISISPALTARMSSITSISTPFCKLVTKPDSTLIT